MKTDRLMAITIFLLNHKTVSASALAKRFEVSKRTIQRDIEALNQAGIPIVSTFGTNGGYEIIDGFKLTKQMASGVDYSNIITALKALTTAYENKNTNATLDKALSVMRGAEQRIFVDFTVAREKEFINEYLQIIEKAIYEKTILSIEYSNAEGISTKRTVEPLALSFRWYSWYLFAYCTIKKDYRLFKLTRIKSCETTAGFFSKEHPDVEYLMKINDSKDDRRHYKARILCKKEIRQQAIEYLSGYIVEESENGDFIISIDLPFERMWFSLLMGFGDKIKVLDSEELKDMLKQKAKEIMSVYE